MQRARSPGLNPNHPNARMKVPSMTRGMLWGTIGLTILPFESYFPDRGPMSHANIRR